MGENAKGRVKDNACSGVCRATEVLEHIPVLVNEVVSFLEPCFEIGTIVDATVGGGGHSAAICERMVVKEIKGQVVGIDIDPEAIAQAELKLAKFGCEIVDERSEVKGLKKMVLLVHSSYVNIEEIVERLAVKPVAGVLLDLGISAIQLNPKRGFSFDQDGPLDMRFNPDTGPSAREILLKSSVVDLKRWFMVYGDEPFAGRIARRVYQLRRNIRTTRELAEAISSVVPKRRLRHTLARVFQALRIVVNKELENLKLALRAAVRIISPGGRLLVVCYQSGEDRCVKELIRLEKERIKALTAKPIRPSTEEIKVNPRARSARLRVMERR